MSVEEMRNYIWHKYPHWRKLFWMPDNQIVAIYHRMREDEDKKARMSDKDRAGYQFTIYDFM